METFAFKVNQNTDKTSDEFLSVNNFGYYKKIARPLVTKREKGRQDYQIIYIDKGYGFFFLRQEMVKVSAGHIVLLPPGTEQYYEFPAESMADYYWIHFTGSVVPRLLSRLRLEEILYPAEDAYLFKNAIESMISAAVPENFTTDSFLSATVYSLLTQISKNLYLPKSPMEKILYRMQGETINTLRIKDYADLCLMSEYHFIRSFKKATGKTPHRYLAEITVKKGVALLSNTTLNISEIASALEFRDALYFSRFFKQETGYAPSDYLKTFLHKE